MSATRLPEPPSSPTPVDTSWTAPGDSIQAVHEAVAHDSVVMADTAMTSADPSAARSPGGMHWAVPVATFELLLIAFLLARLRSARREARLARAAAASDPEDVGVEDRTKRTLEEARRAKVDMGGLMQSIHLSRDLYKELGKRCHPDRFPDPERKRAAEELFQLITRHRRDYPRLVELRERAQQELGLEFAAKDASNQA